MKHFSLVEFVAYKRGDLPAPSAAQMGRHFQEGCEACTETLGFVERMMDVAQRDRGVTPPSPVLARARAVFRPVPQPGTDWMAALAAPAQLIFDSLRQPAAVGVRGVLRLDRHLVFAEGDVLVDVCVEPDEEAGQQTITGQVQSQSGRKAGLSGLHVLLVEGPRTLMGTRTNSEGEFLFSGSPCRELGLCVVCQDRVIKVPKLPVAGDTERSRG